MTEKEDLQHHACRLDPEVDYSWWEYDARGIELCRVCDKCRKAKLARYRPEVLTDSQYEADDLGDDEPLDPDYRRDSIRNGDYDQW